MNSQVAPRIIEVRRLFLDDQFKLGLFVSHDAEVEKRMEKLTAQWDKHLSCWHIPDGEESLNRIRIAFRKFAWINLQHINDHLTSEQLILFREFKNVIIPPKSSYPKLTLNRGKRLRLVPVEYKDAMERMRYSNHTVNSYCALFASFLFYYNTYAPESITLNQIKRYLVYMKKDRKTSDSTLNQVLNAIKIYYINVLDHDKNAYMLERPQKEQYRIHYLTTQNATKLIAAASNLKNQCILALMYAGGLVKEDITCIRVSDLNFKANTILVHPKRGRPDILLHVNEILMDSLQIYLDRYQPKYFLFTGNDRKRTKVISIEKLIQTTGEQAKLTKVTHYVVRKSFAHRMLLKKVDPNLVKSIQGQPIDEGISPPDIEPFLSADHPINKPFLAIKDDTEMLYSSIKGI